MNDPVVLEAISRGNPVVFFDITIGGVPSGRVKMELFADEAPKTAERAPASYLPTAKRLVAL